MPKHVLIIGGAGFIGTKITETLLAREYRVTVVDLRPSTLIHPNLSNLVVDITEEESLPVSNVSAVINLAGVGIGTRWNTAYKKKIYDSRIKVAEKISSFIQKGIITPSVVVQASAVGYYGDVGDALLSEESSTGTDFLAHVCRDWEDSLVLPETVRKVFIRTAHVLGQGGLLATLRPLFKIGLGAYFGTGRQYMSWVHIDDIVGIYIHAIEQNLVGPYNTAAGEPITQKELFRAYARSLNRPLFFRIPRFLARLLLGEFGLALCGGQKISSKKLLESGYVFLHTSIDEVFERR